MPDNNLPSWRQDLKSSRKKEGKSPSNKWFQLATVSDKNKPRLRTVVFRGWSRESSMFFFTDRRSEKIKHLEFNPHAEVLWFFYKSKTQFRFKGEINELFDNVNYWDNLSEKSKASWFWESPGKKKNTAFKSSFQQPANLYKPKNFVVLELKIYSVDLLILEKPIHKRYLWESKNNWEKTAINP